MDTAEVYVMIWQTVLHALHVLRQALLLPAEVAEVCFL